MRNVVLNPCPTRTLMGERARALACIVFKTLNLRVKPVTVNIRDGQNVTAIAEASRICHVAVTDYSQAFTDFQ